MLVNLKVLFYETAIRVAVWVCPYMSGHWEQKFFFFSFAMRVFKKFWILLNQVTLELRTIFCDLQKQNLNNPSLAIKLHWFRCV
jgi:hypothetical protein